MRPDLQRILSYDEEARIHSALAMAAGADGLAAPERVETALLAELRRRNRRGLIGRVAALSAIAAAVVAGLWLMRPAPVAPQVIVQVQAPREILIPVPVQPLAAGRAPVIRPGVRRAVRQTSAPKTRPAISAEFIPVGVWQAIEPMERGSIVRIRLPKSSLPGLGIPVSADRWNESVPADVVLGEDGTLRAIRLVSQWQ
ncbi:MAG: hypothetical protein HYX27_05880 [Acidobacteria bacterium]|nr:hypothetical protein [Acidobacteriota bacterium]